MEDIILIKDEDDVGECGPVTGGICINLSLNAISSDVFIKT